MLATPRAPRRGSSGNVARWVWMTAKVRSHHLTLWFRRSGAQNSTHCVPGRAGDSREGPSQPHLLGPALICLSFCCSLEWVSGLGGQAGPDRAVAHTRPVWGAGSESLHRDHRVMLALQLSLTASLPDPSGSCRALTGQPLSLWGGLWNDDIADPPPAHPSQWYCALLVVDASFPRSSLSCCQGTHLRTPKGGGRDPGSPPHCLSSLQEALLGLLHSKPWSLGVCWPLHSMLVLALDRCPHDDSCSPHTGPVANPK